MFKIKKKISLSTFDLKMIAVILMLIDHVGEFFPKMPIWFRYLGRISAPLFFFCMTWGMDYTKSRFPQLTGGHGHMANTKCDV